MTQYVEVLQGDKSSQSKFGFPVVSPQLHGVVNCAAPGPVYMHSARLVLKKSMNLLHTLPQSPYFSYSVNYMVTSVLYANPRTL